MADILAVTLVLQNAIVIPIKTGNVKKGGDQKQKVTTLFSHFWILESSRKQTGNRFCSPEIVLFVVFFIPFLNIDELFLHFIRLLLFLFLFLH